MATDKTYPSLTADEAAALIPNGAMLAVSGFTPQLHGMVHQVCTGELSYPCLLFEWPKENLCNQAFTARSSGRACDTRGLKVWVSVADFPQAAD